MSGACSAETDSSFAKRKVYVIVNNNQVSNQHLIISCQFMNRKAGTVPKSLRLKHNDLFFFSFKIQACFKNLAFAVFVILPTFFGFKMRSGVFDKMLYYHKPQVVACTLILLPRIPKTDDKFHKISLK